ncbi:MAG: phosphatidylglycerophosphatase A [Rhodosalinus sp.]|uniref:phosphatidylglycerophosphatase A family protein n=1 Tax=Rhodosalinus sp. TaxID=2047741 RepID=UPI00397A265A
MTFTRAVATLFGLGYLRPGPGTWASAAALPLLWALHVLGGFAAVFLATLAVTAIGWWAVARATAEADDKDPSEIVIDELAGQWLALWPVSAGAAVSGAPVLALWPGWVAGFVLFRLFDILKPGPVGWADRRPGATGVMLDDLIAGLMAAAGTVALAALFHLWLMA